MFKWNPEDYHQHSSAQEKWAKELIAKLNLKGDELVLDIGSGDGKVTLEIARHLTSGSVLGVDSSIEMIQFSQELIEQQPLKNISFMQADASLLPFRDDFDIVFSNAALHWIFDHRPVLKGIYRSLKMNGRILLQMGGKGNAAKILSLLDVMMKEEKWKEYFFRFGFSYGFHGCTEYRTWLEEAGLRPTRLELIPKDMTYPDRTGLESWIRTTWLPYTGRIPETRREEFIHEIAERYIKKVTPGPDGIIHMEMMRLEVEAVKP
ncbi:MAG: methyltransferase domain-containing protein [bacterium]|nr:methyltransferase domain-containing protein [bacterium]